MRNRVDVDRPAGGAADASVLFGITGDSACEKRYQVLSCLEPERALDDPVIGVASSPWTSDELRGNTRDALVADGQDIDERVWRRFADRLDDVSGDHRNASTFAAAAPEPDRP